MFNACRIHRQRDITTVIANFHASGNNLKEIIDLLLCQSVAKGYRGNVQAVQCIGKLAVNRIFYIKLGVVRKDAALCSPDDQRLPGIHQPGNLSANLVDTDCNLAVPVRVYRKIFPGNVQL
jgi:hypothetical protein